MPDWVTILPIINATGIPLLAFSFFLLFRVYHRSIETHQGTIAGLRHENERLRQRLSESDASYTELALKMRAMAMRGAEAVEELEARKITLLSKKETAPKELILEEVQRINESIQQIEEVQRLRLQFDVALREETIRTRSHLQHITSRISGLAQQVGDVKARVAIAGLVTSRETHQMLVDELKGLARGMASPEDAPDREQLVAPSPWMLPPSRESEASSASPREEEAPARGEP